MNNLKRGIVCTIHCSSIRLSAYDAFQLEKFVFKRKENCTNLILYDRRIENLGGIHWPTSLFAET
jgi:hypothetical protein